LKPQGVRLIDVFVLGPFMVWSAVELRRNSKPVSGYAMLLAGVATVLYNGHNYLEVEAGRRD